MTNHKKSFAHSERYIDEAIFHDKWADSVQIEEIKPIAQFESPTAVEYRTLYNIISPVKHKKVLVLGCGLGEEAVYLAHKGAIVTAIDISPKMIDTTKKLAKRWKVAKLVSCKVMSSDQLTTEKDQEFDCVIGCNILHHVDIRNTCVEVKRVVKKGGKVLFIEPLAFNPVINIYRNMGSQVRTSGERPLNSQDIATISASFPNLRQREFHLTTLLIFVWFFFGEKLHPNKVRYWKKLINEGDKYGAAFKYLYRIDSWLLHYFPLTRYLCWETLIDITAD